MKRVALAHHALAHDWYTISLATIDDAEWLVRFCVVRDRLLPADKRDRLVHVVCKRKFPLDYRRGIQGNPASLHVYLFYCVSHKKQAPTDVVPSSKCEFCFADGLYMFKKWSKCLNATTFSYRLPKTWCLVIMFSNVNHNVGLSFTTFCNYFVCGQQKNDENGPASKFTLEVISWNLSYENHQ